MGRKLFIRKKDYKRATVAGAQGKDAFAQMLLYSKGNVKRRSSKAVCRKTRQGQGRRRDKHEKSLSVRIIGIKKK